MSEFLIKDGFKCDRQSKYDFTATTVNHLSKINKPIKVIFKEFDKKGNIVDFDSPDSYEQSPIDLKMYMEIDGKNIEYNVELKERWNKYNSNYYGKENDSEGWVLNIDKVQAFNKLNGIPLYVNLYPDKIVRIWNLDKINSFNTITKYIADQTVKKSKKSDKDRYEVWNKDSKVLMRYKGNKSNGIWNNHLI